MAKRCEANPCFTASARSSRIACWKCDKPYHLKCAGVSGNQQKIIRDCSGAEWLCVHCRNSKDSIDQKSTVLTEINERLSSIIRLIYAQIDVTRSLCRAYGQNLPRSSCCNHIGSRSNDVQHNSRNFEEEINNMQLEFSKVFDSFLVDTDRPADVIASKRNRTSSSSPAHFAPPRISKRIRTDASVNTSDLTIVNQASANLPSGSAESGKHQPAGSSIHKRLSNSAPVLFPSRTKTTTPGTRNNNSVLPILSTVNGKTPASICPAVARQDTTPLICDSIMQTSPVPAPPPIVTNQVKEKRPAKDDRREWTGAISSAASQPRNIYNQRPVASTSSTVPAFTTQLPKSRRQQIILSDHHPTPQSTRTQELVVTSGHSSCITNIANTVPMTTPPLLFVAPPAKRANWFYISRFLPHETCENIILYVSGKCKCEPTLVRCHKLLRQNREDSRPITFLSFKLNVPDSLESFVCSKNFWPAGVSINPFLERSATRARHNPTTPLTQNQHQFQEGYQQLPIGSPARLLPPTNLEMQHAAALPRRAPRPPPQYVNPPRTSLV